MKKNINYKEKKKISMFSIIVNLVLSIIKIIGGFFSGSAALMADGVHSLSDLAASVSVYIGILISNKKSDNFPLGLYKVENLVALISSFAIFFAGYEIAKDVFFGESMEIKNLPIAVGVIIATVLITFLYSKYEKKKGKELNSPSLLADAEHIKVDFYTALVVLVGILANYFGFPIGEKIAVIVVVVFIFHSGFEILKEAIKVLLDASIDNETISKIKEIISKEKRVKQIKTITGRNSGSFKFVRLDLVLNVKTLDEAHDLAHEIEAEIKEHIPFVEKVIVHYE